ncbi:MAG: hypothetical protein INQ03_25790 [Candidatus Heimdallarchaeota archaeon]|nr:hypothetical protein [Candidatus Heimdallarchaeota archaeon]
MTVPRLGHHFELCITINDMNESVDYYEKLGFSIYTGGRDKGWCTMTDGIIYLALFPDNFLEKEFGTPVLFNYRGGNVKSITESLAKKGIDFYKNTAKDDGTGDALFKDINDYVFYIDTADFEERVDEP